MSVKVMTWVFEHSASKGASRLVLLAMADEAANSGELTAYRRSQSWLAAKANLSTRSVRTSIDDLVALGELVVLREGLGRACADYRIVMGPEVDATRAERISAPPEAASSPSSRSFPVDPVTPCPPTVDEVAERFARFWSMYPRKEGKKSALAAFRAMVKRKHLDSARAALALHMRMWEEEKRPMSKIPLAASWLNQERYFDDLAHFLPPEKGKHPKAGQITYDAQDHRMRFDDNGIPQPYPEED